MSADKSEGGRPPAPPGLRRVNVPLPTVAALYALALACVSAHAGPIEFTSRQNPDNWSDWDKHVLVLGVAPAFIVELVAPEWSRPAKFGACMIPGLAHEFIPGFPTPGNTWSLRDVVSNGVGCGIGLLAFEGRLRVVPTPGGVQLSYSVPFK